MVNPVSLLQNCVVCSQESSSVMITGMFFPTTASFNRYERCWIITSPLQVLFYRRGLKIQCSGFSHLCVLPKAGKTAPCAMTPGFLNLVPSVLSWLLTYLVLSQLPQNCQSGPKSDGGNICATAFVLDHLQHCQICHWAKYTWEYNNYIIIVLLSCS